jgi:hypothetical protein
MMLFLDDKAGERAAIAYGEKLSKEGHEQKTEIINVEMSNPYHDAVEVVKF